MKPTSWRPEGPAETPYQRARQEWDRRMGAATVQAANWRRAAFGLMALLLGAGGSIVYLGSQPKLVPQIIEVDRLGEPKYLGPLDRAAGRGFTPSGPSIEYHLRRFILDTREVPSDAALVKRNWMDAYKLVTPTGANQLNAYVEDRNPFAQLEAGTRVTVDISVILQITADTWQVDWTETSWDDRGNRTDTTNWRGTFHVFIRTPDTTADLAVNPLGLYIDELHWARLTAATSDRTVP